MTQPIETRYDNDVSDSLMAIKLNNKWVNDRNKRVHQIHRILNAYAAPFKCELNMPWRDIKEILK